MGSPREAAERVSTVQGSRFTRATPDTLRRMREALADGVSGRDFYGRFGVNASDARKALGVKA